MNGEEAVQLTEQEARELQRISRSGKESPRARLRATILLMSSHGLGAKGIAQTLGVSLRTVRRTRARWRQESYSGLDDDVRSGRPALANKKYIRLLYRVVRKDPRRLGFAFAHWTAPRLAEYLRRQTGIALSPDRVRSYLKVQGFVWRRTKLTTRNLCDPRGKKAGPEAAA